MTSMQCPKCSSAIEAGDLRCAVCAHVIPGTSATRQAVATQIMRCDECGAAVSYDAAAQAPRCVFCAATVHVESVDDPQEQTEYYLPFTAHQDEVRRQLRQWLSTRGFFCPSDLASDAQIEAIVPMYWVCWLFQAEALISWAADSNAGASRADWAPHAGEVPMTFENVVVSASRGLTAAETEFLTASYDLTTTGAPSQLEGLTVEQFDVQRSEARDAIVAAIESSAIERVKPSIPGSKIRKLKIATLLRGLSTARYAMPAYVLAYRYRGTPYRAVVSGQRAEHITGGAPISWTKVALVIAAVAGVIAIIAALASGS